MMPKAPIYLLSSIVSCFLLQSCKSESKGLQGEFKTLIGYHPSESTAVFGGSLRKFRESEFYSFRDRVLGPSQKELTMLQERCGLDLLASVDSIVASTTDISSGDAFIVSISGSFTRGQIEDCYLKFSGVVNPDAYSMLGRTLHVYWPSASTIVFSSKHPASQLKANASAGGLKGNSKMMKLVSGIDPSALLWAVGKIPPEAGGARAFLERTGLKPPIEGRISVVATKELQLDVGLQFRTKNEASAFEEVLDAGLKAATARDSPHGVGKLLSSFESASSNTLVSISSRFGTNQIDGLFEFKKALQGQGN